MWRNIYEGNARKISADRYILMQQYGWLSRSTFWKSLLFLNLVLFSHSHFQISFQNHFLFFHFFIYF